MWPRLWFLLFFGIQNNLVRSDGVDSEDADIDGDGNGLTDFRRAYGEYVNSRSNQPQCPSVSVCQLIAGPLNAIRTALRELEATSSTYCGNQRSIARFQPMNFPPFPSMDFMQVPSFPPFPPFMSAPNNNPVVNPPLSNPSANYPQANYPPFSEHQRPNPQEPEPNKVNSAGENPWSVFTGTQKHKKIKVKICNPRRSGRGKKKHAAAAAAPLQKPPGEEKEKNEATTELDDDGTKVEDNARNALSTTPDNPPAVRDQKPVINDEKEEKID